MPAGAGAGGRGFTIAQEARTLTIARKQSDQTVPAVYNLDGGGNLVVETTPPGHGGGPGTLVRIVYKKG